MLALGTAAFGLISGDAFGARADPSGETKGLTTTATQFVTAAVGTTCGVGYIVPAASPVEIRSTGSARRSRSRHR
ncbi:MAG: hypothetical protein ACHQNA_02115 [Acidimicrobiales bacterium]